jgi:hypothetical protein
VAPSINGSQDTGGSYVTAPVFLNSQLSAAAVEQVLSYLSEGHYLAQNHTTSLQVRMVWHSPDAHAMALVDLWFVWGPAGGIHLQGLNPSAFPVPYAPAWLVLVLLLVVGAAGITSANTLTTWRIQGRLYAEVQQCLEGMFDGNIPPCHEVLVVIGCRRLGC